MYCKAISMSDLYTRKGAIEEVGQNFPTLTYKSDRLKLFFSINFPERSIG